MATQFLLAALLLSISLQASSQEEQKDIITLKESELNALSLELEKVVKSAELTGDKASDEHSQGCLKGIKKLKAVTVGLIQGVTGSFITGIAVVGETIALDLTYFGVHLRDRNIDPYIHTKDFARLTNDSVSNPFNGFSDKECAELENVIENSKARSAKALGERSEIQNAEKALRAISQVPRDAIKADYIRNLGPNSDRGVAQSR